MDEPEDIKRRFLEKLSAHEDSSREESYRKATVAQEAFAPILKTVDALAEAMREHYAPDAEIVVHDVTENDQGDFWVKVFLNKQRFGKGAATDELHITLKQGTERGNQFYVSGFNTNAKRILSSPRNDGGEPSVYVDANQSQEICEAIEAQAVEFFTATK